MNCQTNKTYLINLINKYIRLEVKINLVKRKGTIHCSLELKILGRLMSTPTH